MFAVSGPPGMGEMKMSAVPVTAASVEESPPGFVMTASQARMYSAIRSVYRSMWTLRENSFFICR